MAEQLPDLGARIALEIQEYNRNIQSAIRDAAKFDAALDELISGANKTETAINKIDGNIDVKTSFDDSELVSAKSLIERMDTNIDIDIGASYPDLKNANDYITKLGQESATVKIKTDDQALKTAKSDIDTLDSESIDISVGIDDKALQDIAGQLEGLQNLAVIDLVLDAAGFIEGIESLPIIGKILELDDAIGETNARAEKDIPGVGRIIQNVYSQAFGDSLQQVGLVIAELSHLESANNDLEASAAAAFIAADAGGEDVIDTIQKLNVLVRNGYAKTFEEAADIYVRGIQLGLNSSGDLLDSIQEYTPIFKEAGISIEGMFNLFESGLDAGVRDTDQIADAIKEMNLQIRQGIGDPDSDVFNVLDMLGQTDEAQAFAAGELAGDEFFSGLMAAVNEGMESGVIDAADVVTLAGSTAENLSIPAFLELEPVSDEDLNIEGAAGRAAQDMYDDLSTSFQQLYRTVETELAQSISAAWDIPGKIQAIKDGVNEFSSLIQQGVPLDVALDTSLGLEGTFLKFESSVANFGIGVLELIAGVNDALADVYNFFGNTDASEAARANAGIIRQEVARLAEGQLKFDLEISQTAAEASSAVQLAQARGVSHEAIAGVGENFVNREGLMPLQGILNEGIYVEGAKEIVAGLVDQLQQEAASGNLEGVLDLTSDLVNVEGFYLDNDQREQIYGVVQDLLAADEFAGALDLSKFMSQGAKGETGAVSRLKDQLLDELESSSLLTEQFDIASFLVENVEGIADDPAFMGAFAGLKESMGYAFEEALSAGDVGGATDYAERLNDPEKWEALRALANEQIMIASDDWRSGMEDMSAAADDSNTRIVTSLGGDITALENLGKTAQSNMPPATDALIRFAQGPIEFLETLNLTLDATLNRIDALADVNIPDQAGAAAAGATPGERPGAGWQPPGFAAGGEFEGIGRVHAGEVVMSSPPGDSIGVLNAATSTMMFDAVASVLGGMNFSGVGNTRNVNVQQIFNTQSSAEDVQALNEMSGAVRGY